MLTIESQPNTVVPQPLGVPLSWVIRNQNLGAQPLRTVYVVRFSGTGANGETFRLNGTDFSTDNSALYTPTTFDHTLSARRSAINFANMLAQNPAFADYSVSTERPSNGQPWRVIARHLERGAQAGTDDNDVSGLSGVSLEYIGGRDAANVNAFVWYRFFDKAGAAITKKKVAAIDALGRATIYGTALVERLLGATPPDPTNRVPFVDDLATNRLALQFGVYSVDGDCTPTFNEVATAPPVQLINAVFQHHETSGFAPYVNAFGGPLVPWATRRGNNRLVTPYGFDWTAIYLSNPVFPANTYRVLYKIYNPEGVEISTIIYDVSATAGLLRVPTGWQNVIPDDLDRAQYFTVQVLAAGGGGFVPYSELITVTDSGDGCCAAEVYYLEGPGSWRAIQFKDLQARDLAMSAEVYEGYLEHTADGGNPTGGVLFDQGGTYQRVRQSSGGFTVTTGLVGERHRQEIEEMLESPTAYVLTEQSDGTPVTRRVNFDRSSYRTFTKNGVRKVSVSYQFAQNRRIR